MDDRTTEPAVLATKSGLVYGVTLSDNRRRDGRNADRDHVADAVHHHRIDHAPGPLVADPVEDTERDRVDDLKRTVRELERTDRNSDMRESEDECSNDVGDAHLAVQDRSSQRQREHRDREPAEDQFFGRTGEQQLEPELSHDIPRVQRVGECLERSGDDHNDHRHRGVRDEDQREEPNEPEPDLSVSPTEPELDPPDARDGDHDREHDDRLNDMVDRYPRERSVGIDPRVIELVRDKTAKSRNTEQDHREAENPPRLFQHLRHSCPRSSLWRLREYSTVRE